MTFNSYPPLNIDIATRNPTQHGTDHDFIHRRLRSAIHTDDYGGDLQAAVNAAIGGIPIPTPLVGRNPVAPLVIDPGTYTIDTLKIYSVRDLQIYADNVIINFTGAVGLDMNGVSNVRWHGNGCTLSGGAGTRVVAKLYTVAAETSIYTTGSFFEGTTISGSMQIGLYLGAEYPTTDPAGSGGLQTDTCTVRYCKFSGQWQDGDSDARNYAAIVVGDNEWGNNLDHHIENCNYAGFQFLVKVLASSAQIINCDGSTSKIAYTFINADPCVISGGRIETSQRLMDASSSVGNIAIEHHQFNANSLNADSDAILFGGASLVLINDRIYIPGNMSSVHPKILASNAPNIVGMGVTIPTALGSLVHGGTPVVDITGYVNA